MDETKKRELLIYLVKRLFKERLDNGGFMHPKLSTLLPARKTLAPDADQLAPTIAFNVFSESNELLYRKLLAIGE